MQTFKQFSEAPRIPRKKGQPAGSDKHSDLYTDENPKGTIHGLKFATVKDAEASVRKIENSGKKHAHKIQAAIAMEQRARVKPNDREGLPVFGIMDSIMGTSFDVYESMTIWLGGKKMTTLWKRGY